MKGSGLLFAVSWRLAPLIELPVDQLLAIHDVSGRLNPMLTKSNLVSHVVHEHLGSEMLLEGVELQTFEVIFGQSKLVGILELVLLYARFELRRKVFRLVELIKIFDLFLLVGVICHLGHVEEGITIVNKLFVDVS